MKEKAIAIFEKYLSNFDKNNPKIKWKYIHSYRVADLMQEMAEKLNFDSHNQDLAYVIGLYHDIGRFTQLKEYDSYSDLKTIDHGMVGAKEIKDKHLLKEVLNNKEESILIFSVNNHNKYKIAYTKDKLKLKYAKLIRDADKIEIIRSIITKEIQINPIDCAISSIANKEFYQNKLLHIKNVLNGNDYILNIFTFIYDINFTIAKDILKKEECMKKLFQLISKEKQKYFLEYFMYINEYMKEGITC